LLRRAVLILLLLVAGSVVLLSHSPASGVVVTHVDQASTVSPWFLGTVTTQQATAQEVGGEFYVPKESPSVADTYYPLLLSVYDSNSSYDQIGILGQYGSWAVTTSDTRFNGTATVYDAKVWHTLSPGYYWFGMSISRGVVTFTVTYENGTTLLVEHAITGGDSFVISPTFFDKYTLGMFSGFSVFEEVYNATGGSPAFNMYARGSYFVSNGTKYASSWSTYQAGGVPQGPHVSWNGSSVMIMNVERSLTLASDRLSYYTKEPVRLDAAAEGTLGDVLFSWSVDGKVVGTTADSELNTTLQTAAIHQVAVSYTDAVGVVQSDGLQLEASKISLSVSSPLGTPSGGGLYDFGDTARITVTPSTLATGTGMREALVGWLASSPDGYNGTNSTFVLTLSHDVSEAAVWANQSLVGLRSDPAGLSVDIWLNQGPDSIDLPAFWSNDSVSRISLTGFSVDGNTTATGRLGWTYSTMLGGPMTLTLHGVKQYSVILQNYSGPYDSSSQTGDLWFDAGTQAVVTLPLNYTDGLSRWIFEGWQEGPSGNTITFPSISSSQTARPIMKHQYFVYIGALNVPSPFTIDLINGPSPYQYGLTPFFAYPNSKGAWFDEGSLVPIAQYTWSSANVTGVRYRLFYVSVDFLANASTSLLVNPGFIHLNLTGLTGNQLQPYSVTYGVDGGKFNVSNVLFSSGFGIVLPNGTFVQITVSSDALPEFENGQLVVERPLALGYFYVPDYHLILKTPFGGFDGWESPFSGTPNVITTGVYTYSAPVLSGPFGTQRFVSWQGTVNSSSPSLSLTLNRPYVETAEYATDYWAVASVAVALVTIVCGAYLILSHRFAYGNELIRKPCS
jgi:hypothetical protein